MLCFWAIKDINLFETSATVTELNVNLSRFSWTAVIASTLGWFLHFIIALRVGWSIWSESGSAFCNSGKFRQVTILEKKSFKLFATLCSSVIRSSSSIRVIFSEEIVLLERNGLTIFQKDLLSTTLPKFHDENTLFQLLAEVIHTYFFVFEISITSSLLCFRKQLLTLLRIIITLEISALMNGLWLRKDRCFCGACLFKTLQQIEENASMPSFSTNKSKSENKWR